IIGGGIVGCSIAYHLTKLGWSDVLIIEKGELTSGSTWHAAGLVGQLRSHRNVTRMLQYSVSLYETLEAETGLTTGWKRCGCLHLAGTEARLFELKKGATTARSFGLEMHMITLEEALKLFPILDMDGIIGAAFMPSDGQADPSGLTMALARGAMNRGAAVEQKTLVTGFQITDNRIQAVVTDRGTVRCETVVNAAGMWGRDIGLMMGVNIPLVPFQHQYLVTEAIEGLPPNLPTLRDKDSLLYYKEEVGGLVMGGYERDGIPWAVKGIPRGFTQELLEADFDHFEPISEAAIKRTPCLKDAGIARLVNGPEAFTPDGNCMLGPAPELDNCFVAAGFNAFGIAAGGGAGRMLAEWIVEGEPSLNIWPLDIRRFGQYHKSLKYNVERTKEIYGKHYTISWPYEEHDSARGVKRSPLYHLLKEKGAVYGSKFGWERANWFAPPGVEPEDRLTFGIPNWFEHVASEHKAAREAVVLIDQSSFSKFEVTGPGALSFLNHVAAGNMDRPVGATTYTQLCNNRGGIEADITVSRVAENRFFIVTGTAFWVHDFMWLKKHLPQDGSAALRDVTSSFAMINVCGPLSRTLLMRVSDDDFGNEAFPFGQCRGVVIDYAPVLALRVTYIGELGYELYLPPEYACHFYETLWAVGQDLGIKNAGYRAIDSLRLEKGYCYWSAEVSPDYSPYDAGIGFAVDLDKGSFIGRESLVKIKLEGPKWKLCTFTLNHDQPKLLSGGETISCRGKVVGVVSSGGYGHTVKKTIALGYLPVEEADHKDGYAIEVYREAIPATRLAKAPYDPERKQIYL
ncbi:MAG: FAD-dependent oxidoreductase, partial [Proteobacteria bacterium]|nr:FAD-dependent oxidoreductase [Pseudomonadota bacterium]